MVALRPHEEALIVEVEMRLEAHTNGRNDHGSICR